MMLSSSPFPLSKKISLGLGPLFFLVLWLGPDIGGISPAAQKVLGVAAWMLTWWIGEAVALPVTAMLPLVLFPGLGIYDKMEQVTLSYANPIIFLFLGGFMLALALEKWHLHRRIALNIVRLTGTRADGIIFGFMLATALLSMWISNTATTVMMLPIALSIIQLLHKEETAQSPGMKNFALVMMLGIAYAANIGGIATLIGTPPNSVLASVLLNQYGYEISFAQWMLVGFPFSILLLGLGYALLVKVIYPNRLGQLADSLYLIKAEIKKLGALRRGEKLALSVFGLTAFLWIFRDTLNWLWPWLALSDPLIAMLGTLLLFAIPVHWPSGKFILQWEDTQRLPWGILLLFGGGLCLADGMEKTGLIQLIGDQISQFQHWNIWGILFLITLIVLFMTEVMSNVALVTVMAPLISGIAVSLGQNPLLLCVPITMVASCAFMLPMATPPNAIVFASGYIRVGQMVRAGLWLNLLSVLLIMLMAFTLLPWVFDLKPGVLPDWAKK
ncbi:MAG: SLC13 family permease [Microscillaceae bacterium]